MPEQWTAEVVGKLHLHGIPAKQLAAQIGWNPKYLSAVLNGHKAPKNAKVKIFEALNSLVNNLQK